MAGDGLPGDVIERLARLRGHEFSLERAAFLAVLHRLFAGGSDRTAYRWHEDYAIDGVEDLDLHHLYRAMAWPREELPADQQDSATPFAPRCVKDVLEEGLFAHRRDLFATLDVVFMDTTSLYFEGAGGQTLERRGFSKDHRLSRPRAMGQDRVTFGAICGALKYLRLNAFCSGSGVLSLRLPASR